MKARARPSPQTGSARVAVLGVRHHGVGSAAATLSTLERLQPDILLLEGPPEARLVLDWAAHPDMRPPIALMATWPDAAEDAPAARFFPFAEHSPEWVALRWAAAHGRTARFIDLPLGWRLALESSVADAPRADPFELLLGAGEEGWETEIERGLLEAEDPDWFETLSAAAAAARDAKRPAPSRMDLLREARMRVDIRLARRRAKGGTVAVICGAWHAPALELNAEMAPSEAQDRAVLATALQGHQRRRIAMAWIPWTDARLAREAGYEAGVSAPGWSRHLWRWRCAPQRAAAAWMAEMAAARREGGGHASTAEAIDAARLADALAALRGRPRPDLTEMRDAAVAVFGNGQDDGLAAVERRLFIGETMGAPPRDAPKSRLARSVEAEARRLRLAFDGPPRRIALDRRTQTGEARALFLRRLAALGAPLGERLENGAARGGAREIWSIRWTPEIAMALSLNAPFGPTLLEAADAALRQSIASTEDAVPLSELIATAAEAKLATALSAGLARLAQSRLPPEHVGDLLSALNRVGETRAERELLARLLHALPAACRQARGAAASRLREEVNRAAMRFATANETSWRGALALVAQDPGAAQELRGWCMGQLLSDATTQEETAERADQSVAAGVEALTLVAAADLSRTAAWLDGFFAAASGAASFFEVIEHWLTRLDEAAFRRATPVLRRAIVALPAPDHRALRSRLDADTAAPPAPWDRATINAASPLLDLILGEAPAMRLASERRPRPTTADPALRRRWRLALGAGAEAEAASATATRALHAKDAQLDAALSALYGAGAEEMCPAARLRRSARRVALWLDEVRSALPTDAAAFVQRDAVERLGLRRVLLSPDVLTKLTPDLALAADLAALSREADPAIKAAARRVVRRAVEAATAEMRRHIRPAFARLAAPTACSSGPRPRGLSAIDWPRTLNRALGEGAVLRLAGGGERIAPRRFLAKPRRRRRVEVVACLDQSASMRPAFAEAAVLAATLARTPGLSTRLLAFDDRVADLTPHLEDPVDVLFGASLGGGTNIAAALRAAEASLDQPERAAVLLISDLLVDDADGALRAAGRIVNRGARLLISDHRPNPAARREAERLRADLFAIGAERAGSSPAEIAGAIAAAAAETFLTRLPAPT